MDYLMKLNEFIIQRFFLLQKWMTFVLRKVSVRKEGFPNLTY